MTAWRVRASAPAANSGNAAPEHEGHRWHLDLPQPETTGPGYVLPITGWKHPVHPGEVVNLFDGRAWLGSIPFNTKRPDVAGLFGGPIRTGFNGDLFLPGQRPAFELELRVGPPKSPSGPVLGRLAVEHSPLRTGVATELQPISITSLGRTGTTLLMGCLAAHPQIAIHPLHPYETRIARYWLEAFSLLRSHPGDPALFLDDPAGNGFPLAKKPFELASPTGEWLVRDQVENAARFAQRTIDEHYRRSTPWADDAPRTHFVEKALPDQLPRLLAEIYPAAREVFLLRDFRDMASSILAFNRRRGRADFGAARHASQADFVRALGDDALQLVAAMEERPEALVVRYEDLVRSPQGELRRLLAGLGLDHSRHVLETLVHRQAPDADGTSDSAAHRTAPTAEDSIGRWRSEESPEIRRALEDAFGPALERAGYAA
jgi:hypothetical protein